MIEKLERWRIRCDECRVDKVVDVIEGSYPAGPDGWWMGYGDRGPSGYPRRVHLCEVCKLRKLGEGSEERGESR